MRGKKDRGRERERHDTQAARYGMGAYGDYWSTVPSTQQAACGHEHWQPTQLTASGPDMLKWTDCAVRSWGGGGHLLAAGASGRATRIFPG